MDLKQSVTAIQHANEQGLTISNPVVVAIAQRLRVNTPRFIERTQECLPTVVEQQFYLALAADQAMKPETFSRVLRMFVGDRNLRPQDLDRRETAPNIFASRFDNIADFVIGVVDCAQGTKGTRRLPSVIQLCGQAPSGVRLGGECRGGYRFHHRRPQRCPAEIADKTPIPRSSSQRR